MPNARAKVLGEGLGALEPGRGLASGRRRGCRPPRGRRRARRPAAPPDRRRRARSRRSRQNAATAAWSATSSATFVAAPRRAGVAGGGEQLLAQRARGDLPGQRMLAPARTEEEDVHGRMFRALASRADRASRGAGRLAVPELADVMLGVELDAELPDQLELRSRKSTWPSSSAARSSNRVRLTRSFAESQYWAASR